MNTPEISIIIPFLNEKDNVSFLVDSLTDFFAQNPNVNAEVIFVDDGSTDNSTPLLIREVNKSLFKAKVIKLSKNFGPHAAVRAGLLHAAGNYAMFLPADLQDPLSLTIDLYAKAMEGYDIVFAFRETTATGTFEKYFSRLYARLMQKYVTSQFPEKGFNIILFNRKVITAVNRNIESNSSLMLQIMTLGFSQAFIGYDRVERKAGKSKWTLPKKIKLLIDSFIAFSYAPIRFVSLVGILFFILGICWTVYVSMLKILYNNLVTGWAAITSILLLGFGITNISLGIIAEYLWRTLDVSRKRPVFTIDEITDINQES